MAIASTIGIANKNSHEFAFPKWKYATFFDFDFPKLTVAELEEKYGKLKTAEKSFLEKVKAFFQ